MEIRKGEAIKSPTGIIGNRTKVKVVKNKMAPPFKDTEFDIMYGGGISKAGEILDYAVNCGIIEKSGAWFAYQGAKIGQGRDNAKQFLIDNAEIMDEIETMVRTNLGLIKEAETEE